MCGRYLLVGEKVGWYYNEMFGSEDHCRVVGWYFSTDIIFIPPARWCQCKQHDGTLSLSLSLSLSLCSTGHFLPRRKGRRQEGSNVSIPVSAIDWLSPTEMLLLSDDQDFKSFVLIITVIWHRPVMVVTERMIGFEINSNFYTSNSEKMFKGLIVYKSL